MSGDISTLKYSATRGLMGSCVHAARTSSTLCMLMGTRSYTVMRKFPGTGTALSVCYYLQYISIKVILLALIGVHSLSISKARSMFSCNDAVESHLRHAGYVDEVCMITHQALCVLSI